VEAKDLFGLLKRESTSVVPVKTSEISPVEMEADGKEYEWREMGEDRRRILEMLASGKITAAEADRLLSAIETTEPEVEVRKKPRYLRILIEGENKINLRIPVRLISSGMKIATFIPGPAKDQINQALGKSGLNIDFANLTPKSLDELIENLGEMNIELNDKNGEAVKIFCE
jgi:CRISPR/Cas system Type II protein with McrA/HNH and RuvC-like nuclease domain